MILDKIIHHKRGEVEGLKDRGMYSEVSMNQNRISLSERLSARKGISVIAEVKKASPSKGVISYDFDPLKQALSYQDGGADCISVLTDERFFQGSMEYLYKIKTNVDIPVLRKDFIIDPVQIRESVQFQADVVLLIAAALPGTQLQDLYSCATDFGLEVLAEVHNRAELDRVLKLDPDIVGINNRNLMDFSVTLETTMDLIGEIPDDIPVVSESGVFTPDDIKKLLSAGVSGVLIGEALMKSGNPRKLITQLMGV